MNEVSVSQHTTPAQIHAGAPPNLLNDEQREMMMAEAERFRKLLERHGIQVDAPWLNKSGTTGWKTPVKDDGPLKMRMRWSTTDSSRDMLLVIESVKGTDSTHDVFLVATRKFSSGKATVLCGGKRVQETKIVPEIMKAVRGGIDREPRPVEIKIEHWNTLLETAATLFTAR